VCECCCGQFANLSAREVGYCAKDMCDVVDAGFPMMEQELLLPLSRPKLALEANLASVSHAISRNRPHLRRATYNNRSQAGKRLICRCCQVFPGTQCSHPQGHRSCSSSLVGQIGRLRSAVHGGVYVKPSGRSCTVNLALLERSGIDPAVSAITNCKVVGERCWC
jgi:hypothetical protein